MSNQQSPDVVARFKCQNGYGLSFITEGRDEIGNAVDTSYFDVPDEDIDAGIVRGMACVVELLESFIQQDDSDDEQQAAGNLMQDILCEAAPLMSHDNGRRGAAIGFCAMLGELLFRSNRGLCEPEVVVIRSIVRFRQSLQHPTPPAEELREAA